MCPPPLPTTERSADERPIFRAGDRVRHAGKPEWGAGEVTKAQGLLQSGVKCQRLSIRFERAGLKHLSTAAANIRPADEPVGAASSPDPARPTPLDPLEPPSREEMLARLATLPPEAIDPTRSARSRVEAMLSLYRFSADGGSLLDWAATQTRLADPLAEFSRAELEERFVRFSDARDRALRDLVADIAARSGVPVGHLRDGLPTPARDALARLDARR